MILDFSPVLKRLDLVKPTMVKIFNLQFVSILLVASGCFFTPLVVFAQNSQVIEVVIFHSNSGVSPNQMLKSAEAITPTLKSMPGFISRTIGHGKKSDEWIDVVRWQSMEEALTAAKKIENDPKARKFMSLMSGYKMYHFRVIGEPG